MAHKEKLFTRIFQSFAEYGLKGGETREIQRAHLITNIFTLILMTIATIMFTYNYLIEEYYNSSMIAFFIIAGFIVFLTHLGVQRFKFSFVIFTIFTLMVTFALFWLDLRGEELFLWVFLMPVILGHVGGSKRGSIATLLLIAMVTVLLFSDLVPHDYSYVPRLRFYIALIGSALLSLTVEYAREKVEGELRHLVTRLNVEAHTDALTGLFNRRDISVVIRKEMGIAKVERIPLSVLMCDIDFFKEVNDTLGHDAGDRVLVHFSRLLRGMIRGNDYICRWGGEEFLIVLPETAQGDAYKLANRLRQKIHDFNFGDGENEEHMTASFGVSTWNYEEEIDAFLQGVDQRMYNAKELGRDRVN